MGRLLRSIGALIVLVLIAGAVAIGVIAATSNSTGVKLKQVGGNTVDQVVNDLKQLVQDNQK